MKDLKALLTMFGERYIYCDDQQAAFDVQYNRENLVSAFSAIMHTLDAELEREDD